MQDLILNDREHDTSRLPDLSKEKCSGLDVARIRLDAKTKICFAESYGQSFEPTIAIR